MSISSAVCWTPDRILELLQLIESTPRHRHTIFPPSQKSEIIDIDNDDLSVKQWKGHRTLCLTFLKDHPWMMQAEKKGLVVKVIQEGDTTWRPTTSWIASTHNPIQGKLADLKKRYKGAWYQKDIPLKSSWTSLDDVIDFPDLKLKIQNDYPYYFLLKRLMDSSTYMMVELKPRPEELEERLKVQPPAVMEPPSQLPQLSDTPHPPTTETSMSGIKTGASSSIDESSTATFSPCITTESESLNSSRASHETSSSSTEISLRQVSDILREGNPDSEMDIDDDTDDGDEDGDDRSTTTEVHAPPRIKRRNNRLIVESSESESESIENCREEKQRSSFEKNQQQRPSQSSESSIEIPLSKRREETSRGVQCHNETSSDYLDLCDEDTPGLPRCRFDWDDATPNSSARGSAVNAISSKPTETLPSRSRGLQTPALIPTDELEPNTLKISLPPLRLAGHLQTPPLTTESSRSSVPTKHLPARVGGPTYAAHSTNEDTRHGWRENLAIDNDHICRFRIPTTIDSSHPYRRATNNSWHPSQSMRPMAETTMQPRRVSYDSYDSVRFPRHHQFRAQPRYPGDYPTSHVPYDPSIHLLYRYLNTVKVDQADQVLYGNCSRKLRIRLEEKAKTFAVLDFYASPFPHWQPDLQDWQVFMPRIGDPAFQDLSRGVRIVVERFGGTFFTERFTFKHAFKEGAVRYHIRLDVDSEQSHTDWNGRPETIISPLLFVKRIDGLYRLLLQRYGKLD